MSYDILFVPRRPGQDWDEALDAAEGSDVLDAELGPERLAQWERIVAALRRRIGDVEVSTAPDVCEATADDGSGLQVSLFPDEAAVTFPYWERPDRAAFHDVVVDVVGIVERETGLHAWDAQADQPFDGHVHDGVGLEATRRLAADPATAAGPDPAAGPPTSAGPRTSADTDVPADTDASADTDARTGTTDLEGAGVEPGPTGATAVGTTSGAGPAARPSTPDELARDRRRALRYLVIGVVVVIGALLLRSNGESSTLSGLAIAIGVFDIVIGAALWRSWRRRSQEQA